MWEYPKFNIFIPEHVISLLLPTLHAANTHSTDLLLFLPMYLPPLWIFSQLLGQKHKHCHSPLCLSCLSYNQQQGNSNSKPSLNSLSAAPPPDTHEYSFDLEQTYFCQVCTDVTLLCLQFSCPCYCFTFDVTLKGKCHLVLHTSIIPHIILRVIAKCLAHVNKISMACAPPAFWLHFPSTLTFS